MAKRKTKAERAAEAASAPAAPVVNLEEVAAEVGEDGPLDPTKYIAIDVGGGSFTALPILGKLVGSGPCRERTITFEGRTFEHVAEHRGVWAYRHLG